MQNPVDEKWLRLMIGRADYSMRAFARALDVDIATVHRVVTGKRKLQLGEVKQWAALLGVSVNEFLPRVGMDVDLPLPGGMTATLRPVADTAAGAAPSAGSVAATGEVTFAHTQRSARAAVVGLDIVGDPFMAGWRVLCSPSDVTAAPVGAGVGLVKMKDGRVLLRKFRPGFTAGRFDLGPALGMGEREDDAEIVGVIPVVGVEVG